MKMTTARVLTYGCCAVMVFGGAGAGRWLVPAASEVAYQLMAAASELVGLGGLCVLALLMEPQIAATRTAPPRNAGSQTEPHPLAS